MDARVATRKDGAARLLPGHDAGNFARIFHPGFNCQTADVLDRPYSLAGTGYARSPSLAARSRQNDRRRAGRQGPGRTHVYARRRNTRCSDPRASTPRDIEACRSPDSRRRLRDHGQAASPPVPRRPAGCLKVCSASPPVDCLFRPPSCSARRPIHRCGPERHPHTSDRAGVCHCQGGPRHAAARRDGAAWTAGPPRRISSEASFPGHRSPPCLTMLIRHPSVAMRDLYLI